VFTPQRSHDRGGGGWWWVVVGIMKRGKAPRKRG
jgi:uncharacterized membrane protein YhaH (DUF805 family)